MNVRLSLSFFTHTGADEKTETEDETNQLLEEGEHVVANDCPGSSLTTHTHTHTQTEHTGRQCSHKEEKKQATGK
jgi:hypothetical protein